jgi:addiction module RelE/StbE family toxin
VKIIWTPKALQDRSDIWDHIANDNPRAAARMDELFSDAVNTLLQYPLLGRPGRIAGTRELIPHESYCLVYEVIGEIAWVQALIHTTRQWPPTKK